MSHAELQQKLLSEDTPGDSYSRTYWRKAFRESPRCAGTGSVLTIVQECKATGCGQRFSQLGNLKVSHTDSMSKLSINPCRHTRDDTLENGRIVVTFAGRPLLSAAMFERTRSFINRLSLSPADSMTVGSSSLS
jgi:hypothetical protein